MTKSFAIVVGSSSNYTSLAYMVNNEIYLKLLSPTVQACKAQDFLADVSLVIQGKPYYTVGLLVET